ncbi:MAG: hypothetical protein ACM359_03425 [Bacillota bacterium]
MDSAISTASPDWSTIHDQILCPLCDYNLRGLPTPRCPECGYQFDWPEVLDPALRRHPYLFEHHHNDNLWSFWATLKGSLRPRTFWRSLHLMQPSHIGRLLLYWILTAIVASLPLLTQAIPDVFHECSRQHWRISGPHVPQPLREQLMQWLGPYTWRTDLVLPSGWSVLIKPLLRSPLSSMLIAGSIAYLLWPIATFALLMIFQSTMRKARIKPGHVLRCVIYSADPGLWVALLLTLGTLATTFYHPPLFYPSEVVCWLCLLLAPLLWLMMIGRLAIAYRLYLRFQHPASTVLATQFILLLLILIALAGSSANWF